MNTVRPKNLDLFTIRFPLPAIVSILHRISGVVLFLLIPFCLWLLQYSLTYTGYDALQTFFHRPLVKFVLWGALISFVYHLVAGIRHLFADMHIGTTLVAGRMTAKFVFVVFVVLSILLGVWIW